MSKKRAKEKLKSVKDALRKSAKRYEGLGDSFDESENRIIGPRNDIEFQKLKKDIKESGHG
jgi:hypothetical protein